jgi:hypothetical protein
MDASQFETTLASVEVRLRRLRMLYDQYFQGLERIEPQHERADVDRIIDQLRRSQPRNTALRFRFNQLVQRFTTYNVYWQRIRRQIEEGTYKRDVLRARRRFGDPKSKNENRGLELELDIDIEATLDSLPVSQPPPAPPEAAPPSARPSAAHRSKPPRASEARPSPAARKSVRPVPASKPKPESPPPPPPGGPSEAQIQALYKRYLDARRNNQERTDNVKLETIAKTVRDMIPKLAAKHAGKRIEFDVVLKDGRVALKPVPK